MEDILRQHAQQYASALAHAIDPTSTYLADRFTIVAGIACITADPATVQFKVRLALAGEIERQESEAVRHHRQMWHNGTMQDRRYVRALQLLADARRMYSRAHTVIWGECQ